MTKAPKSTDKGGRPSHYCQAVVNSICAQVTKGMSLNAICKQEGMADKSTVYRWLEKYPDFCEAYARACEERQERLFEECLHIADSCSGDARQAKLRIDTRKWMLGKMNPKKYGEKQTIEHEGNIEVKTKEQRDAAVQAALRTDS